MTDFTELAKDLLISKRLSVLLKGKPGSGKTSAALSFPGPVLCLYADPNTATLRQWATKADVVAVQIEDWNQYDRQVRPLLRNREALVNVQTVVFDSWSFFTRMLTRSVERNGKLDQQAWGAVLNRSVECCMELVTLTSPASDHLGCNVVVTCHTRDIYNDAGFLQSVDLSLQGSFRDSMEGYFDYSLLLQSELNEKSGAKEFTMHSIAPPKHGTCKGGELPATLTIPAGRTAFEVLNETWKIN